MVASDYENEIRLLVLAVTQKTYVLYYINNLINSALCLCHSAG